MKHIKYDIRDAYEESDISGHPLKDVERLGITYQHATPQSMGDQWWLWNVENLPNDIPSYITELKADPMKCIGFGLSEEKAIKIRDYKK